MKLRRKAWRPLRAGALCIGVGLLGAAAPGVAAPTASEASPPPLRASSAAPAPAPSAAATTSAAPSAATGASCADLARSPWPRTGSARQQLIADLDRTRERCKNDAPFLALLGGLWLEEGEPEQALLWLERALLLEPQHLGAQADYALALAAQGDLAARNALLQAWEGRPDVPPLVLARLRSTTGAGARRALPGNGSHGSNGRWVHAREATALLGYESNLNHSPRLSELTLTFPDESIVLPLPQPQRPRAGQAQLLDLSWQSAYALRPGVLVQGGLQAVGRHAPQHAETDWHSMQAGLALLVQRNGWRGTVQWTGTWFGGPLSQPYRAQRGALMLESTQLSCQQRLGLDFERRTQAGGDFLNAGQALGLIWSGLCPTGWGDWRLGLAARAADDRPSDAARPGGRQRQASVGLRALGSLAPGVWLDLNLRHTRARDDEGYSDLLANNARRQLAPTSLSVELTRSLDTPWGAGGLELVTQIQAVRQNSNLPLFRYSAYSLFLGSRARW